MTSIHIHHAWLSGSLHLANLVTFAAELFWLTGQGEIFFPYFRTWPEHVRPRQQVWGSAELQLICTCIRDFSLCHMCRKSMPPVYRGPGGHPYLARCSHLFELPLLQTTLFYLDNLYHLHHLLSISRIQATAPRQKPFMTEIVLKAQVLMESLHGKQQW